MLLALEKKSLKLTMKSVINARGATIISRVSGERSNAAAISRLGLASPFLPYIVNY